MNDVNNNPKVTILMPVYNGEAYLRQAIDSIINQTFRDYELLIINDGSTDSSVSIIKEYNDPRIRVIHNEKNLKLIASLNKGLEIARGEYIARMDCDDISLPQRLEKQVEFMESHRDVGLCGSWIQFIGKREGTILKYPTEDQVLRVKILFSNYFAHPSVIMRKEFLDKYHLKYSSDYIHVEDYKLWLECSKFFKIYNLGEVLLKYRMGHESISKRYSKEQKNNAMRIYRENLMSLGICDEDVLMVLVDQKRANKKQLQHIPAALNVAIDKNTIYNNNLLKKEITRLFERVCIRSFPIVGIHAYFVYKKYAFRQQVKCTRQDEFRLVAKFAREIFRYIKSNR